MATKMATKITPKGLKYAQALAANGHISQTQINNYALAYNKGLRLYAGLRIKNNGKPHAPTHGANLLSNQFFAYSRASAINKITLCYYNFCTQNNCYFSNWLSSLTQWLRAGAPTTTNPNLTSIW
jgi:hypothetical protein